MNCVQDWAILSKFIYMYISQLGEHLIVDLIVDTKMTGAS